jgi:peroxiredoxin
MEKLYRSLGPIIIVFSIVCLIGCSSDHEEKVIPSVAPDFSLKTIEGEEIKLKDYRGKKVVHLVFWSTQCKQCLTEIPNIKNLWDSIGNRPYEILAVNVGLNESQRKIKQVQTKYAMPFKIVLDINAATTKDFGVISIPTHIVIDKEGFIIDRFNLLPKDPVAFLNKIFTGKKNN